jgi:nicotinate-nucleotide adenylyltransferase
MSFDFRESTALFGGSFHPPHLGHTQAALGLLSNPGVKKVMVLPSFGTPLKKVTTSFNQRLEMAQLAFEDFDHVEVSDFENEHQTQFTWQLLEKLAPQLKNPVFVIGTDQLEKIDHWAKFPEFLKLCDWIILIRKPSTLESIHPVLKRLTEQQILKPTTNRDEFTVFGNKLKIVPTDAIEVSSSWIREKLAMHEWESVKNLIAPNVRDYIVRNKIYGK